MESRFSSIKKSFFNENSFPGNESGDIAIRTNDNKSKVTGVESNSPILIVDISAPTQSIEIKSFTLEFYSFYLELIVNNTVALGRALNSLKIVAILSSSSLSRFYKNVNDKVGIFFKISNNKLFSIKYNKGDEFKDILCTDYTSINKTLTSAAGTDQVFARASYPYLS